VEEQSARPGNGIVYTYTRLNNGTPNAHVQVSALSSAAALLPTTFPEVPVQAGVGFEECVFKFSNDEKSRVF
jgi:hypothetical protein